MVPECWWYAEQLLLISRSDRCDQPTGDAESKADTVAVSTWKGKTDVPNRLWIGIDAALVNIEVVVYTSRR